MTEYAETRPADTDVAGRTLRGLVLYFLRLGSWGFGGPIALCGYMHRDLVERRRWYTEEEYQQGMAVAQTMPGPLAAQLAMWLGYLERGSLGALAVTLPFVLPPFLIVTAVAVFYAHYQGLALVEDLFFGVGPAVMAIIAIAAYRLSRATNKHDPMLWTIAVLLCVVTSVAGAEIAWLFIAAGLFGAVYYGGGLPRFGHGAASVLPLPLFAGISGFAWTGAGASLGAMALFFIEAGAFTFGSGLAIVPFLHEGLVESHAWLTEQQFTDAVAMGLISPGPVVIMATFPPATSSTASSAQSSRPPRSSCPSTCSSCCRVASSAATSSTRACRGSSRARPQPRPGRSRAPRS